MTADEIAEMERDPLAYLDKLLKESGIRATLDARRCMTDPCWLCATSKAPRDLVAIGVYTRPMGGNLRPGDRIERPLCASCEKLTQPPPAPADDARMPEDLMTVVRILPEISERDHVRFTKLLAHLGKTPEQWVAEQIARAVREPGEIESN